MVTGYRCLFVRLPGECRCVTIFGTNRKLKRSLTRVNAREGFFHLLIALGKVINCAGER